MLDIKGVIKSIIEHQRVIIGPLALEQANKVAGITVSDGGNIMVTVKTADNGKTLTELVQKYEALFGRASIEVCRDAVKELSPRVGENELPQILR